MATIAEAMTVAGQYQRAGHLREAEQIYRQIVQVAPGQIEAWNNLGEVCRTMGQLDEAAACFQQAQRLTTSPPHHHTTPAQMEAVQLNRQGIALFNQGRLNEAVSCFKQAMQIQPDRVEVHGNLGNIYYFQGDYEQAVACYQQAPRLEPEAAWIHNNLGNVLCHQGRHADAVAHCQHALQLAPGDAGAHNNLGNAFKGLGKLDLAASSYREAVRLKPDYHEAYNSLGLTLMEQGKTEEALAQCQKAVRLKPDFVQAHNIVGLQYQELGKVEEALVSFEQALRLQPDNPNTHWNRASALLLLGRFEQGWPETEWRYKKENVARRPFPQPVWDGSALGGRKILLCAEQGLGDTIQFVRYASLAKERGGFVIVECPESMLQLLASCPGVDQVVVFGSSLPAFDCFAPLPSVPGIVGTTLQTIPADVPYLFADPQLTKHWRQKLSSPRGFKIGIFWQGNPLNNRDRQRSIPLSRFAPLAQMDSVRLFSLQTDKGIEQLADGANKLPITDLGSKFATLMDTAAVVTNLDLVVTIDTAIAHLAGALGAPVWVLLPFAPDWRWLLEREDSPWYPGMRLFRQKRRGDWDEVFERITEEVKKLLVVG